jgi:hypothetical protein
MTAFWDIALCNLVEVDRHFRGAYCLRHQKCILIQDSSGQYPRILTALRTRYLTQFRVWCAYICKVMSVFFAWGRDFMCHVCYVCYVCWMSHLCSHVTGLWRLFKSLFTRFTTHEEDFLHKSLRREGALPYRSFDKSGNRSSNRL